MITYSIYYRVDTYLMEENKRILTRQNANEVESTVAHFK